MPKMRAQKFNSRLVFSVIFVISTIANQQSYQPTIFPVANALNSLKLNAKGQPRLCSVIEGSLNGFTRLCFGKATKKDVQIQALSNRKVLKGELESLNLTIEKSQSSLIALDSFTLQGNNLHFGYLPLAIAAGIPTIFWFLSVRAIIYLAFLSFLWRNQREYFFSNPERIKAVDKGIERQRQRVSKVLLGEGPCRLNYQLSMTNDSLQNSAWVQALARSLVQTFMANSALPLAAAVSDATNNLMLLDSSSSPSSSSSSAAAASGSSNLKNAASGGGLTWSQRNSSKKNSKDNPIVAMWKEQEEEQRKNQHQNQQESASPSFPLTELFAATSFELRQTPIFAKDGHVWLPCVANLPGSYSKRQLEFTLRTKPSIAFQFYQQQADTAVPHGLEFSAAECSLDVDAALDYGRTPAPNWAKQFLPSIVWLPIGGSAGVMMMLPVPSANKMHRLKRIKVQDDLCQMKGEIDLFRRRKNSSDQGEGIGKAFGNLLQSFNNKRKNKGNDDRPKLPGGR